MPKIRIISLLVLIIAITAITLPNFAQRALAASSDSSLFFTVEAETLVKADGPGGVDTYDLIRQKLGTSSIEAPDVFRNNHQGVRHIVENTGSPYGPYFTFILHDEDGNKDEVNSDRQRNEIKGDGSSPEKVLGRQGETARYHWYFRVAPNYKASNTIMFQLHNKDEGPIVKIESMGDNLVFRHDPDNCNCGKEAVLASHPFNVLRGQWLEAEVVTTYTNSGYLHMTLRDQSGKVIMHTEKNKIDMWSSSFTRPKWGIYRGTKNFNDQDTIDFADFRIQEITLQLSPPVNQAPNVDAGPDQTITLLAVANLTGTVTDDGLPNPPAAVTTTWSMVSGPGSVSFGNAGTPATTAGFSQAGTYVLQLMAGDSNKTASGDVTVTVNPEVVGQPLSPVGHWKFDEGSGSQALDSSGNGNHGSISGASWAAGQSGSALSFDGNDDYVQVPTNLWNPAQGTVAFWAMTRSLTKGNNFFGHSTQPPFANRMQLFTDGNQALNLGLGDAHERHMGITTLQPNRWYHLALTWDGTRYKVYVDGQESASGSYTGLTKLHSVADIGNLGRDTKRAGEAMDGLMDEVRVYNRPLSGTEIAELAKANNAPVNQAPNVDAGPDQTITLLAVANLTGTVTDDGLPNPPAAFTTTWSMVSGPGSVIFGNAGTPVTTASFSHAGEYTLRLTATDSELSASDDVTINVEVVYGDSTQDGKLTAEDVHLALDWLFGQSPTPPSGSASFVATDVNNNGVIDGDDVRLMIDRLLSQP